MPQDHEDGTIPAVIIRADMTLCVDITAQTIGNIGIDIKAQTLGQLNINIAASAVKLAITINAADITGNIPIDIKTQTLGQVNINIKAQTLGQLNVNLAASAITLNVNISSQTANINVNLAASAATVTVSVTGTANISITAQSVGIYLKPDWEVKEGHQKTFRGVFPNQGASTSQQVQYTVTTGKTLYIVYFAIASQGAVAENRNTNQICRGDLRDVTADEIIVDIGGNGGAVITFPPPVKFPSEHVVTFIVFNGANHNCNLSVSAGGYEI